MPEQAEAAVVEAMSSNSEDVLTTARSEESSFGDVIAPVSTASKEHAPMDTDCSKCVSPRTFCVLQMWCGFSRMF